MKKITLLISVLMLTVAAAVSQVPWEIGYPDPSAVKATVPMFGTGSYIKISGTGEMKDFPLDEIREMPENPGSRALYWHEMSVYHYCVYNSLIIEEGITRIGANAFFECSCFKGTLTIPASVTTIGTDAFFGCWNLSGPLIIPQSVTKIENGAFAECHKFSGTLTIPASITKIESGVFSGCIGLDTLIISEGITRIGSTAFQSCSRLSSVTIPESVTEIEDYAFNQCRGLISVNNYAMEPQNIKNPFPFITLSNITLNVPVSSLARYQEADVWKEFNLVGLYHKVKAAADNEEHGTATGAAWYESGERACFTATPAKDYEFVNWTKDGVVVSTENPYTFSVTGDAKLTANFRGLTVSLNDTQADNAAITGYYSILGEKLPQAPQSGVYIIMYANGKTEKIVRAISK